MDSLETIKIKLLPFRNKAGENTFAVSRDGIEAARYSADEVKAELADWLDLRK